MDIVKLRKGIMNKKQIKQKEKRIESLFVTLFSMINSGNTNVLMIQELKDQLKGLGVEL